MIDDCENCNVKESFGKIATFIENEIGDEKYFFAVNTKQGDQNAIKLMANLSQENMLAIMKAVIETLEDKKESFKIEDGDVYIRGVHFLKFTEKMFSLKENILKGLKEDEKELAKNLNEQCNSLTDAYTLAIEHIIDFVLEQLGKSKMMKAVNEAAFELFKGEGVEH